VCIERMHARFGAGASEKGRSNTVPRWRPMLQNLATALDPIVRRQLRALKRSKKTEGQRGQVKQLSTPELRLTPVQRQRREHLQEKFRLVQSLYQQRRSVREIAGIVQIDPNTCATLSRASHGPRPGPLADERQESPAWMLTCPIFTSGGRLDARTVHL